jgi:sorting nexin-1/2
VVEKYKMTTDFIEQRRLALDIFLNRVVSCTDASLALAVSWRAPAWPALHTVYAAAMQAAHTALQHSPDLQLFLEANETEFAIEVSRGDLEGSTGLGVNAAKKTLSGALQLFRTLGHSASNMYQRKTDDDDEDPEYLKAGSCALVVSCMCTVGVLGLGCVFLRHSLSQPGLCWQVRTYLSELEKQLGEVHRHAARLVRHRSALGSAVQEFGAAMQGLGRHEESVSLLLHCVVQSLVGPGPWLLDWAGWHGAPADCTMAPVLTQGAVSELFDQLGEKAEAVSRVCFATSESLARSFEAPLKEFVRMVRAANKVAAERSAALAAYQQVRADVDAHRARLAKVRGTPGIREERVAEVERDLNSVQRKADEAKAAFEVCAGVGREGGAPAGGAQLVCQAIIVCGCQSAGWRTSNFPSAHSAAQLISGRMKSEVARFQQERTQEMAYVLRDFAVAQSHLSADSARLWRSLVPGLAQADAQ